MGRTGVMAEIRRRLQEGETPVQLISEGLKSGSVYKVRWELDKQGLLVSNDRGTEASQHEHRRGRQQPAPDDPLAAFWALVNLAGKREPVVQGHIEIFAAVPPEAPRVVIHPETLSSCPSCYAEVAEWAWCEECRGFYPVGCECDYSGQVFVKTYAFEEIAAAAS